MKSTLQIFIVFSLALASCALSSSAYAQLGTQRSVPAPTLDVELSAETVEIGSTFEYRVELVSFGQEQLSLVKEPEVGQFAIVGRAHMPRYMSRQGMVRRSLNVTYSLRASTLGTFEIEGPVAAAGDRKLRGKKLRVKVVPRGKAPKPKVAKNNDLYYIDASIEPKRAPYVGEQITLEYNLYMDSHRVDAQVRPPNEPSLDAFWIEDLSGRAAGTKQLERIGDRYYSKILLSKYALFGLRAGPAEIDPMSVGLISVGVMRRQRDVTVESEPIKIDVQPLPPDAPEGFHEGNVGAWRFMVTTDAVRTRVGRAVTVRISATGNGQPGRLQLPELPDIDGGRVAHSDEDTDRRVEGDQIVGSKVARYSITPLKEGQLLIPALEFSYFDPSLGVYKTERTEPITIAIAPGELPPEPEVREEPVARDVRTKEDLLSTLRAELEGIDESVTLDRPVADEPFERGVIYWALLALGGVVLLWLSFGERLRASRAAGSPKKKRKAALAEALRLLDEAAEAEGDEGWDLITRAIKVYLTEALSVPKSFITRRELPKRLVKLGVPGELAEELGDVFGVASAAKYGSARRAKQPELAGVVSRARAGLEGLHKLASRGRVRDFSQLIVLFIAAGALIAGGGEAFASQPVERAEAQRSLERALELSRDGEWEDASSAWDIVAEFAPKDPVVLYNQGTAAIFAGELAKGRLALERAVLHDPQSRDAVENLELVSRMIRVRALERSRGRTTRVEASDVFFYWDLSRRVTGTSFALVLLFSLWGLVLARLGCRRITQPALRDTTALVGVMLAVIVVGSAAGWLARGHFIESVEPGIVMSRDPALREGPNKLAATRRLSAGLEEGTRVVIEERRDEWVKVRLPDESSAWVHRADVASVR